MNSNGKPKPQPKFEHNLIVKVPEYVDDSCKALIVGSEYGPDLRGPNTKAKVQSATYVYYLRFARGGEWFRVSEEELTKWQGE